MIFGGFGTVLVLFLLLGVGLFLWLRSREMKRASSGQSRVATWRLVFAAIAALVMLFSGGCSLLFLPDAVKGNQYVDPVAILVIGGIPFAVALLIFWLSLRRGTAPKGPTET